MRLYKELCREDKKQIDTGIEKKKVTEKESSMYPAMRLSVLTELGYDTLSFVPDRVRPHRWHGKTARRQLADKQRQVVVNGGANKQSAVREEVQKKKMVNEVFAETIRISKIVQEVEKLTTLGQSIPEELVLKLANAPQIKTATAGVKSLPPIKAAFTKREPAILKSVSQNKWSAEERAKLNELFLEAERPSKHVQAWQLYYKSLAQRFCALFRHRSEEEVILKLQSLLLCRQYKEKSEPEFWSEELKSRLEAREREKGGGRDTFGKADRGLT